MINDQKAQGGPSVPFDEWTERSAYMPKTHSDPIRCWTSEPGPHASSYGYDGPGWYFYDETWTGLHGPFSSLGECRAALAVYAREVGNAM